jgi:hypothetical protein
VLTALGAPTLRTVGDNAFIGLALLSGVLTAVAARVATSVPPREGLAIILLVGLALRLLVLPVEPLLSNDIYRYVWDGRVQAAGINPYRYVPADPALIALRDEAIFARMNRADYAVTIYPPIGQAFFFLVTRFGESVTVMKAAFVVCEAVTVAVVISLLRRLGRPATLVVAYLWHPLPVWEIANNGHVDALMIALIMVGIWIAIRGCALGGAFAVALAVLAKPFAILILPALWRPFDWRMPALVLGTAAAAYVPYLSVGTGVLGFLTTGYAAEEKIDSGEGFWVLLGWRALFGVRSGDVAVYGALALAALGTLALRTAFRRQRTPATVLSDVNALVLVFLFLLSPNFPWYFLIAVPFLALVGGAPAWVVTIAALMLGNDINPDDPNVSFEIRDTAFNLLFLTAVVVAWVRRPRSVPGGVGGT